ncbi:hypothetical protein CLOSTMETH_02852 [[Clostridium] methylpentosum DSM 5476]|uniref:Uncharacterized protein n=1 Tax=[Clostridium] methylpentosum DSM 5476 TaxID=537013 RepID=C0EG60_9FIRM|nr:hypothetical protein CLOSTMETH_02852 [[Clostridium] methylpentosum DSM 5476]
MGKWFYREPFKNEFNCAIKKKKTGKKRYASYSSFPAPCMPVTLFEFLVNTVE